MKSKSINLRAILLETFFLVLGVLLALAANNWRENSNNRQRAAMARASIVEELATNHNAMEGAIGYHSQLMDTLYKFMRQYGQTPDRFPGTEVFHKGFVNPASTLSSAWDAATGAGVVEHLPYDELLLIARIYKLQEQYEIQSRSIGQQIYSHMFDEGTQAIVQNYRNLVQIIGSFVYTECGLAEEYARVIPLLKKDSQEVSVPPTCQYVPRR